MHQDVSFLQSYVVLISILKYSSQYKYKKKCLKIKYFTKIIRSIFKLKFRYVKVKAVFEKERFSYNAFVLKKDETGFFLLFSAFSEDPGYFRIRHWLYLYIYICLYIYYIFFVHTAELSFHSLRR